VGFVCFRLNFIGMVMSVSIIFLIFALILARTNARNDCADPLSCYLNSLEIDIPDMCQDVKGTDLCIKNFACYGINLGGLPSKYVAPTTLDVGVEGLGTNCKGDYSYGHLIHGSASAIVNATNFDVGLYIGKEGEMPVSATFSHCEVTSMDVTISFSSKILDGLAPMIEKMLKDMFYKLLCTELPQFLETNVTSTLVNVVDPKLQVIIDSQPSPVPTYNSHYTAWGDSIVSKIKKIMDKVEGVADLKDFLLCMITPSTAEKLQRPMIGALQALFLSQPGDFTDNGGSDGAWQNEEASSGYRLPTNLVILQKANFPPGYNSSVTLTSVQLRGLDTITALDILEPLENSNVTLRTVVGFQNLTVELGLELDIVPTGASHKLGAARVRGRDKYTEHLKVTLALQEMSFLMDLVVAVDAFVLKSYFLDQLSTRACWLSALKELSIANLQLHTTVVELAGVQVAGSAGALEAQVLALINNAVLLVISPEGFGQLTTDVLNGALQGPLRASFNERAAQQLADAHKDLPCLTHYPYNDHPDYIVWANSTLVKTVDFIVNDLLGYQGVNKLMNCATNGTGEVALNTSRLSVSLGGLNSFYELKVLSPLPESANDAKLPYELESSVGLGYCPYVGSSRCNPFELLISFNPEAAVSAMGSSVNSQMTSAVVQALSAFDLSLSLSNFTMYLNTELKMDKDGLRDTQYGQLGTHGCVESSFSEVAIEKVNLHVADARLSIDQGGMQRNVTFLIDKVLDAITRDDKISERNNQIAYELSVAEETCLAGGVAPNVVTTDDDGSGDNASLDWEWEMFILVVGCLSCLVLLLVAYHRWGRAGKGLAGCTPAFALQRAQEESPDMPFWTRMYYRWDCKNSLLFHPEVPLWVRIAAPVCILGDIAMFLASNIDPSAVSVMVKLVIGQKTIDVGSVFDFGLKSTVVDMWDAKVYTLAILILFFSGAWPYVKLLSMLVAWVAPPKLVSVGRRETILVTLDVLGKWSLIDFFVMILMLCAFYFNIYIGQEIAVNVTVLPKWGFYSFLLATMISLGLGHIILACHRLVTEPKVLPIPEEFCPHESLSSVTYEIPLNDRDVRNLVRAYASSPEEEVEELVAPLASVSEPTTPAVLNQSQHSNVFSSPLPTDVPDAALHARSGTTMLVQVRTAGKVLVVLLLMVTALFVVAGTFMLTMRFEFKGLVGLMLKDAADVDYSFVTVGTSIPEHSGVPNDFATRWLQASLFLFGQAMPLALLLTMLILWLVPMTLGWQRTLFVLAEVLNAWSALDVFCISIAAALLEIQQFAAFIVGDSCDSINVILEEYMDEALEGDDKCFDVVAKLDQVIQLHYIASCFWLVLILIAVRFSFLTGLLVALHGCSAPDRHMPASAQHRALGHSSPPESQRTGQRADAALVARHGRRSGERSTAWSALQRASARDGHQGAAGRTQSPAAAGGPRTVRRGVQGGSRGPCFRPRAAEGAASVSSSSCQRPRHGGCLSEWQRQRRRQQRALHDEQQQRHGGGQRRQRRLCGGRSEGDLVVLAEHAQLHAVISSGPRCVQAGAPLLRPHPASRPAGAAGCDRQPGLLPELRRRTATHRVLCGGLGVEGWVYITGPRYS
jgi:hypothetical protein